MTGYQGKREQSLAARARENDVLALTVEAINAGKGPINRAEAAVRLRTTVRTIEWAFKCLVRQGRLSIEGYAANHRHHVPGVGVTAWSFGRPPQPRPAHKIARAEGRPPPEKPETLPFSMAPIRGSKWTARTCLYVVGEVKRFAGADLCGEPVRPGSSYCHEHHARCFVGGSREKIERDTPPDYRIKKHGEPSHDPA